MNGPTLNPSKIRPFYILMMAMLWAFSLVLVWKALLVPFYDADLWWHLAAGRAMVEHHAVLRIDIFSFSLDGTPWINFEWLSEIFLFLFFKWGGLKVLFVGKIVACFAVLFILGLTLRRAGAKGPGLFILSWAAFLLLQPRLFERIELVTLIFIGLLMLVLMACRQKDFPGQRFVPWILFTGFIVWVNSHGGFIYGMGILFLFLVGAWLGKERPGYRRLLERSFVLSLITLFINPYGPRLIEIFIDHFSQVILSPHLLEEWGPSKITIIPFFWGLYGLSSLVLVGEFFTNRKNFFFWAPVLVVFAVGGGLLYRNSALFSFVALPFLAETLAKKMESISIQRKTLLWSLGWMVGLIPLVSHAHLLERKFPTELVYRSHFPFAACQFIKGKKIHGKMYNTYEYGGVISWELSPGWKVFMDGRYIFYPLLEEQQALNQGPSIESITKNWADYFNRYGITMGVVSPIASRINSEGPFPLNQINIWFPRKDWALVYWDDAALVFLKRITAHQETIESLEYNAVWPYNLEQMKFLIDTGSVPVDKVTKELERHDKEVGFTVVGNLMEKQVQREKTVPLSPRLQGVHP